MAKNKEETFDEVMLAEQEREVMVGTEKFTITPLVKAEYSSVLKIAISLAMNIDDETLDNLMANIGVLVNMVSDELLLEVYSVVLDKDKEWINNNLYLKQESDLLLAIIELNDVQGLVKNFMRALKVMNLKGKAQQAMEAQKKKATSQKDN